MSRWRFLAPPPAGPVSRGPVPSFSVIVPAYQVADFVGEAVESALSQTVPPHEVIVCDDGSTDDLDGALAPYRERIVLIRQENRGLPAAKNAAARRAAGEFVAVLDGDDAYLPERLEALGELAASRPDLDVLATDVLLEAPDRVLGRFVEGNPFPEERQREEILRRSFLWAGAAIRRARLFEVGGFDESLRCAEDWDCWIRMIFDGSRIGCVDEPLARYRIRPGSITADRGRDFAGRIEVLEKALASGRLNDRERAIASATIASQRPRLVHARAAEALACSRPDARRLLLEVAREPALGPATRLRAAAAALAPALARRSLGQRARGQDSRLPGGG